jgi:hypothetical protein
LWLLEADEFYSVVKINLALMLALFHALAFSRSSAKRIRKCAINVVDFINTKKVNAVQLQAKQAHRGKQG